MSVKGLDELLAQLTRLPDNIETKALKPALREGAKVYVRRIKANVDAMQIAPDAKKKLKRALIVKPYRAKKGKGPAVAVRIRKPRRQTGAKQDAWFYHFLERGTAERYRKARGRLRKSGYRYSGRKIGYAGSIKAQPFIAPAAHQAKSEAAEAIARTAQAKLIEALKK